MQRRAFNKLLCSWLGCASLGTGHLLHAATPLWFASASEDSEGRHSVVVFDEVGGERFRHPLISRAHQVLKHPTRDLLLVVDRRPGRYLDVLDSRTGTLLKRLSPQEGQDFCGHIQFTLDGRFLLTTESITHSSEGLVVTRDLDDDFDVIGRVSSGGLGPHQLIVADADTLVVANGGIHERGREKLNLQTMQPNLSYLDLHSGDIVEQVALAADYHQASIRHIDVVQGQVLLAMQHQGALTEQVPLVARHRRGEAIEPLPIPEAEYFQLRQYCGSACLSASASTAAVSAPRGDKILFWDLERGDFLRAVKVADGCGIARTETADEYLISSGRGRTYRINARSGVRRKLSDKPTLKWDNHLARV
ncbi:MAG: DUF1513 domain-containing protein [Pseudomonadales bacterium]